MGRLSDRAEGWNARTRLPIARDRRLAHRRLAITSGILVSYLVDYGLSSSENWRLMFGLAAIPAILMFTGVLFQHESPHWLVAHGRETRPGRFCGGSARTATSTRRSPRCASCPGASPPPVTCSTRRSAAP
jgi:MFS family permease